MRFTPVRLSPTLRASCVPRTSESGFHGWENSCACASISAARTRLRHGLSMRATLRHRRTGRTGRIAAAPDMAGAAVLASGLWRLSFLAGRLLPAEEPDDGADHNHRDANPGADARAPVVDPAQQREFTVHEMQHE